MFYMNIEYLFKYVDAWYIPEAIYILLFTTLCLNMSRGSLNKFSIGGKMSSPQLK